MVLASLGRICAARMLFHVFSAVMLRESGASSISETPAIEPIGRGVLDRAVEPGDDIE
jgi:hypothetical protein